METETTSASAAGLPYAAYKVIGETDLAAPVWNEIRAFGQPLPHIRKGSVFYPASDSEFYCIESGRLRMDFISSTGRQRSLLIYEAGSFVNLAHAVHGRQCLEPFSVLADARLWRLDRSLLIESDCHCPSLARLCLKILSAINLTYHAAITLLDVDEFKTRFCRYLVLNMRRYGGARFCLGLTQDECAQTLGVHRATLARTVQSLKVAGVISCFTRELVEVLDPERLLELSGLRSQTGEAWFSRAPGLSHMR